MVLIPHDVSGGAPPPGVFSLLLWEHSRWRQLAEMPQKASPLCRMFPNSSLIWAEQLGLLVPAEVQLAARLTPPTSNSGRLGEFSFSRFYLGIRCKVGACLQGLLVPVNLCSVRSPPGEKGKAREGAALRVLSPSYSDFTMLAPLILANPALAPEWWERWAKRGGKETESKTVLKGLRHLSFLLTPERMRE